MKRTNLSLRGLEIFQLVAKSGSVRQVATETGLSISTVSHHLRAIEESLGVSLVDHTRRPMVLTPAGSIFARHVEEGLRIIRRGETELTSGNLAQVRELRLGIVDDFDSEVAPELAQFLARAMPKCTFKHHTRPSHEIIRLLSEQKLDAGLATRPISQNTGLTEYPVLRDPFVVAVPTSAEVSPEDCLADRGNLPFLRYSSLQIIGSQIEAHLRRSRVSLPNRFELESNHSLLGMVADGSGWAITTPTSFVRAKRFHDQVVLHPYPGRGFARTLSLFATELYPQASAELIAGYLRRLIKRHFVDPISKNYTWLSPGFRVLESNLDDG
ncbi:LysR family transcriptional regulator [Rhodobacteraceae bacterium 2CG4]|uniref:LysR family transcriptional regulator n=2 Tax=Halovulum marinum TaxID=2662447 RepID=A0A6L5YYG7_9RHOB|nr:LysR family transcriptional regulator [Halovulum marinum]